MDEKNHQHQAEPSIEEQYFGSNRKNFRSERKIKSANDRSKYKKTDHKKYEANIQKEVKERSVDHDLFRGRVLSVSSQGITVDCEGESFVCMVRGLLKRERTKSKSLVTVGDFVQFAKMPDHEGVIVEVEQRQSTLSRADNLSRKKEHLIAANIDQVLITTSVVTPLLKPFLIDRYIIAARKGNMEPVILFNKVDLLDDPSYDEELRNEQRSLLEECKKTYENAGIAFLVISVEKKKGLDLLREKMKDRASVFSGQSGAGKSSLINVLTGLNFPVGETVRHTKKGAHTTTQAQLVRLDCSGFCIDTPGIKSFGLWSLDPDEIEQYYTEIHQSGEQCHFPNCSHSHEKRCQVKDNVASGKIPQLRFDSYLSLIKTITEKHQRR